MCDMDDTMLRALAWSIAVAVMLAHCAVGVGTGDPKADAGSAPDSAACSGWAVPSVASGCHACSGGQSCQQNGCYGGYWCETSTMKCHPPPSGC